MPKEPRQVNPLSLLKAFLAINNPVSFAKVNVPWNLGHYEMNGNSPICYCNAQGAKASEPLISLLVFF